MDSYLSLSLQLSYTQEGTAQRFVETFFDEESKGTDFIYKNCLEVLKQHQHLLILGNPGAGKTTLLLQLAHSLLQQYEELQIPIVFNLASWTTKESSFKQWLQNILVNGYGFSAEFAAKSLTQNTILPLLDGFDEIGKVDKEAAIQNDLRQHCLEALGQYVSNENVQQFIICSRRNEYEAVPQNAPIRAEILVNPLSIQQIEAALTQQKNKAPTNKERILLNKLTLLKEQQHPLLEILCKPFYFNLIFDTEELTHALSDIEQLPQKKAEIEQYLLSEFIHKKINNVNHFSKSKITHYLCWLAYWMNGREAVSFELADLQPTDLERRWLFGLIGGFVACLFFYLLINFVIIFDADLDNFVVDLFAMLPYCLFYGIFIGLTVVLNKNFTIKTEDIPKLKWINLQHFYIWLNITKQTAIRAVQVGLIFVLILYLAICLHLGLGYGYLDYSIDFFANIFAEIFMNDFVDLLVIGLVTGFIVGLIENIYLAITIFSFFKTIKTPYTRLKSGLQIYFLLSFILGFSILLTQILFFETYDVSLHLILPLILFFISKYH